MIAVFVCPTRHPRLPHSTCQLCYHSLSVPAILIVSPSLFLQPPLRLVCSAMNSVANRAVAPFLTEATSLSSPVTLTVPCLTAHHRYRNLRVYEVSPVVPLPTPQMRAIQVSWGLQHAGYCVKGEDAVSRAQEAGVMLEVEACVALLCEIVSSTSS